jgi:hypothetical protein
MIWIVAALLAAFILVLQHRRYRELGDLPSGELVSSDHGEEECPLLISLHYGLKGKPDALVRTGDGALVPLNGNVPVLRSALMRVLSSRRSLTASWLKKSMGNRPRSCAFNTQIAGSTSPTHPNGNCGRCRWPSVCLRHVEQEPATAPTGSQPSAAVAASVPIVIRLYRRQDFALAIPLVRVVLNLVC